VAYLDGFLKRASYADEAARLGIPARRARAVQTLETVQSAAYLETLRGTLGAQPIG
jgi:hypothetical protein